MLCDWCCSTSLSELSTNAMQAALNNAQRRAEQLERERNGTRNTEAALRDEMNVMRRSLGQADVVRTLAFPLSVETTMSHGRAHSRSTCSQHTLNS